MKNYTIHSCYIGIVETNVKANNPLEALRIAKEISKSKDFKYMDYQNSFIIKQEDVISSNIKK